MLVFLFFLIFSPICFIILIVFIAQFFKLFQIPKLSKNWASLHQKLGEIKINKNNEVFAQNVRNTTYNKNYAWDYSVKFLNKKYNLNDINKLWIFVNHYGFAQSHTIFSFEFNSHNYTSSFLTISYDIRKTSMENFEIYKPIVRNFEGFYLLATEQDTLFLRTNILDPENCYLYPTNLSKQEVKQVFLSFVEEIDLYKNKPHFYRICSKNCLSEMFKHLKKGRALKYTKFNLLNLNYLLFNSKLIADSGTNNDLSFDKFKEKYKLKPSLSLKQNEEYSVVIR